MLTNLSQIRPLLAFALFILPSIFCGVTKKEMWPFSNYPMYSSTRKEQKKFHYELVLRNASDQSVQYDAFFLWPLDKARLSTRLSNLNKNSENKKNKMQAYLVYYAAKLKQLNQAEKSEFNNIVKLQFLKVFPKEASDSDETYEIVAEMNL